jgi:hypothetical protein
MMVYVPLMFLSQWREYPLVPCLEEREKLDDRLHLDIVEIARVT